ncbi:MAG: hypothetical protein MK066_00365 [Crocinitomicaceae bacterium]|nr:hypothetical protein [Crocinitomicaceae bacterium]
MSSFFRNYRLEVLVFIFASIVICFLFYPLIFEANQYTFSQTGDGIKNYYTFMQHATNDSSFWTFESMNYPYTENIVFTDAQPILSYIIRFFGLGSYSIGIMHFLMIFSIVFAALFLFKILRYYDVPVVWSALYSLGIALLSPQLVRFTGHFSLSYVCAIPIIWYLIIRLQKTGTTRSILTASISIFILFFIHPYLGLICSLFSLAYFFILFIKNAGSRKTNALLLFILGLLPIICFQLLITLTDSHVDRQSNEHMFYEYYASFSSILAPIKGPMTGFNKYFNLEGVSWETRVYLGTGSILLFLTTVFWIVFQPKKIKENIQLLNPQLWTTLIAAFLILLFSFCIPMKYNGFRWITEIAPSLTQFRVLGRFAWLFYYVFAVIGVIYIHRIYLHSKFKHLFFLVFSVATLFTFIEGYYNTVHTANTPEKNNPFLDRNIDVSTKEVINELKKYDAFIFLPFTHLSSEKIFMKGSESSLLHSFVISQKSKKPMINTTSSRVSLSEAKKVQSLFGPSYCKKEFISDLPKKDSILIIHDRSELPSDQQELINFCEKVFENTKYVGYLLNTQHVYNPKKRKSILTRRNAPNVWMPDSSNAIYQYDDFDTSSKTGFLSDGVLKGTKTMYNIIKRFEKEAFPPGNYELSFWYNLSIDRPDVLAVVETRGADNEVQWSSSSPRYSTHFIDNWAFTAIPFTYTNEMDGFLFMFTGNNSNRPYELDHLLIRNTDTGDLYKTVKDGPGNTYVVYNNRYLRLN